MATIQGVGGTVAFVSGFNGKFTAFTLNLENPEVDVTGFSDNGNAATESGGPVKATGTATVVGTFDAASTAPIPSGALGATPAFASWKGSATFTYAASCSYACTIVVTSVATTRSYNGRMEITFSFTSSGAITQTWDETGA